MNVSSSTTLKPLPLWSVYTASKAAINAFTESLALELQQFNVRVNLIIPGQSPETPFGKNAQPRMQGAIPEAYAGFAQSVFARMGQPSKVTHAFDVAEAVWRVVDDASSPLRVAAGADALALFESH